MDLTALHSVQRWRHGKERYRPAHEVINTAAFEVAALPTDTQAKQFILEHHYSGSYPAARYRFGLFQRNGTLAGVAVFSHPCNNAVLTKVFPGNARDSVELGRFVLLDAVPGNGETWFLGQVFRALKREGLRGVLAFSDPIQRTNRHGDTVFKGHIGTIYQAHNGAYLGRSTKQTLKVLPDGRVMNGRAISKIRSGERGWENSAAMLERYGASTCPADPLARRQWLTTALATLTRGLTHPGNHKYAWPFDKQALATLAYPKFTP